MKNFEILIDGVKTIFTPESGPFPAYCEFDGRRDRFQSSMSLELDDDERYFPVAGSADDCRSSELDGAVRRLEFDRIRWRNAAGKTLNDFCMSLRYDFLPGGEVFVNAFFFGETVCGPRIRNFELRQRLLLDGYDQIRYETLKRSDSTNPTELMLVFPERFIEQGREQIYPNTLLVKSGFFCRRQGECAYLEFFLEGASSLDGKRENVSSGVYWPEPSVAEVRWNFQTAPAEKIDRPWQWRNQWGWKISPAPSRRYLPPMRMFHYFDNYLHYPTDRQIDKMAANGADLLILHENWRLDMQNGATPYRTTELKCVIERAHRCKMRVALYVRGSERAIDEEYADWFDALLQKDFDGLYMDYGSPFTRCDPPGEWFPGGCFMLRKQAMKIMELRKRVGRSGVLLSHTGPIFSSIGMNPMWLDMYVSGEGEGGVMTRSRDLHEYFSGAYCSCGSMWTAAFPEYGTAKMVPFMAVAGQSAHVNLGVQFASSSLAHASEPGLESRHLRPLWKLWGVWSKRRDMRIFNAFNSELENGCLFVAGGSALLILANFSERPAELAVHFNFAQCGIEIGKVLLLHPDCDSPGCPVETTLADPVPVEGYGVCGLLINPDGFEEELAEYAAPYPAPDEADQSYWDEVERQRSWREEALRRDYMRISVPPLAMPYEDSLWWDLYDNALQLGYFDEGGEFQFLSWISIHGLQETEPTRAEYIWPGHQSVWISLAALKHPRMGIRSIHFGKPFYSFIEVEFSDRPDAGEGSIRLRFVNQLENDRSIIHWNHLC